MKKLLVLIAAVGISLTAAAQNYNYGVGLRLGYSPSIDFKWNHTSTNSWEFNLMFPAFDGISASAAYEWNWPIGNQGYNGEGFNAYAGPAASVGFYGFGNYGAFMLGVGGMGGIEYKFKIPLALAIDWKPTINLVLGSDYWRTFQPWGLYDFALSIRYAF